MLGWQEMISNGTNIVSLGCMEQRARLIGGLVHL
jgi:hypothetical protein